MGFRDYNLYVCLPTMYIVHIKIIKSQFANCRVNFIIHTLLSSYLRKRVPVNIWQYIRHFYGILVFRITTTWFWMQFLSPCNNVILYVYNARLVNF